MAINIFSKVFTSIESVVVDLTTDKIQNIMNVLEPLFISAFMVYLLFTFISYWNASVEDSVIDFFKKTISWFLILGFSLNIANYNEYIMPIVLNFGDGLAQEFSGSGDEVQSSLDSMADTVITGLDNGWNDISMLDLLGMVLYIISVVIMLPPLLIFMATAGSYLILAKVFCAILAVVGPLFIFCALFPATRQFFLNWLNQVVTYSIMVLILNVFIGMFVGFMLTEVGDMSEFVIPTAINVAVTTIIFLVLLLRIPDLASALGNGMSINGFGQVGRAAKSIATGGKAALFSTAAKNSIKEK